MDVSDAVAVAAAVGLLGYGVYSRLRALRLGAANVRTLKQSGFHQRRLLPWAPLLKVLYRADDQEAVIVEHVAASGDSANPYTWIGFFGSSCIPLEQVQRLELFRQTEDLVVFVGGFRAVLHHPSFDLVVASTGFGEVLAEWLENFAALHAANAGRPLDAACGACGAAAPGERARCECGAVYHLSCADAFDGECLRWGCLRKSTQERVARLVTLVRTSGQTTRGDAL